jgi:hypothetical protein
MPLEEDRRVEPGEGESLVVTGKMMFPPQTGL